MNKAKISRISIVALGFILASVFVSCGLLGLQLDSMSSSDTSLSLGIGEKASPTISFQPANYSNTALTWSSDDNAIASVSASGEITGVKFGTTNITATSVGDPTKATTISIKVTNPSSVIGTWKYAVPGAMVNWEVTFSDDETFDAVQYPTSTPSEHSGHNKGTFQYNPLTHIVQFHITDTFQSQSGGVDTLTQDVEGQIAYTDKQETMMVDGNALFFYPLEYTPAGGLYILKGGNESTLVGDWDMVNKSFHSNGLLSQDYSSSLLFNSDGNFQSVDASGAVVGTGTWSYDTAARLLTLNGSTTIAVRAVNGTITFYTTLAITTVTDDYLWEKQ